MNVSVTCQNRFHALQSCALPSLKWNPKLAVETVPVDGRPLLQGFYAGCLVNDECRVGSARSLVQSAGIPKLVARPDCNGYEVGCLVGGLEHVLFFHILGIIIKID